MTYTPVLTSLLPWLAACRFWALVRKRAKSGIVDGNTASFCYSIINITVVTAYLTVLTIEPVLIQSFSRVK